MARPVRCPALDTPGSFVELEHREAVLRAYMTFPDTALSISSGRSEERKGKNAHGHVHTRVQEDRRSDLMADHIHNPVHKNDGTGTVSDAAGAC